MIHIGNKAYTKTIGIPVNCHRSGILGNPFRMGIDGDRDTICNKYEVRFYNEIAKDTLLRCHTETIKKFLDKHLGMGNE